MKAVIFIGIQGSGKSTFYFRRFFRTHVRINLDMFKTRHREKMLLDACLKAKQPFVVDNTNPRKEDRQRYILPARKNGFEVIGYYMQSKIQDCLDRNASRPDDERVPSAGVKSTHAKLQLPSYDEGFTSLYYVCSDGKGDFVVEEWSDEV